MTNFLLGDRELVLIHIKKSGGTSIRSLWDDRLAPRARGHVPADWNGVPRLAVVRHPRARFLSALRMFRNGTGEEANFYSKPMLPGLTAARALDILEDERIPFDRTIRTPEANLKHHLLPQTHAFCCLHDAGTILRHERLAEDYKAFAGAHGLPADLPHRNVSRGAGAPVAMTAEDEARFRRLFAGDFELLGYDPDLPEAVRPVAPLPRPAPNIYTLWPALFSNREIGARGAAALLPDPDVDLAAFRTTSVRGESARTWPGREADLVRHVGQLMPEFAGQSYLALLLAASIVVIRRATADADREAALAHFHRALAADRDALLEGLSLRWLTSVADTLADHGRDGAERGLGLAGSLLANSVKLYETERRLFQPDRPWPPRLMLRSDGPLFDGLLCYGVKEGDMIANLMARVEAARGTAPVGGALLAEIASRVRAQDTAFTRMAALSGREKPARMNPRRRRLAAWILRLLLP